MPNCASCGTELVKKNRGLLFAVGMIILTLAAMALAFPVLMIPGLFLLLIGSYLIVWCTLGKGLWCRTCKKFPLSR
jgi:hypothetical protein